MPMRFQQKDHFMRSLSWQSFSALESSSLYNVSTVFCTHSFSKTVLFFPLSCLWLISMFHSYTSLFIYVFCTYLNFNICKYVYLLYRHDFLMSNYFKMFQSLLINLNFFFLFHVSIHQYIVVLFALFTNLSTSGGWSAKSDFFKSSLQTLACGYLFLYHIYYALYIIFKPYI